MQGVSDHTENRRKTAQKRGMTWTTPPSAGPRLRTLRERVLQAIVFELTGIALFAPVYAVVTGRGTAEGAWLLAALTLVCLAATPLHNAVYDRIALARTGRTACQRGPRARVCHAISLEVTLAVVELPVMMGLGGHTLAETLMLNVGLTVLFVGWTALFYFVWDKLRPVGAPPRTRQRRATQARKLTPPQRMVVPSG